MVAVVGPSGSGKSTLLSCWPAWTNPTAAPSMSTATAEPPERTGRARLRARMIGVLFQSGNLLPHLTVTGTSHSPSAWPTTPPGPGSPTCWPGWA